MSSFELVEAVRRHAINNYERDGWDILVECYSDGDILELIGNATTLQGAIRKVKADLKPQADYRFDIENA